MICNGLVAILAISAIANIDVAIINKEYQMLPHAAMMLDLIWPAGDVVIGKCVKDNIVSMNCTYDSKHFTANTLNENERISLNLEQTIEKVIYNNSNPNPNKCTIDLPLFLPIVLTLKLGIGNSNIDLSELDIRDISMHSEANNVDLSFNKNINLNTFSIKCKSGSLNVKGLANVGCDNLTFDNVNSKYSLYFDGNLKDKMTCTIKALSGKILIAVPRNIGVAVKFNNSSFKSFEAQKFIRTDSSTYINAAWNNNKENVIKVTIECTYSDIILKEI